jgi:hypothetical protein
MRERCAILVVVLLGCCLEATTWGQSPMISYQGKLTDNAGEPLNATVSIQFSIYSQSSGGTTLWTETQSSISVSSGIFNVLLGNINPIPTSVFNGSNRWLGMKVGSDAEMSPRQQIVSVGYALRSSDADMVDGQHASDFLSTANDWGRSGVATNLYEGTTQLSDKYVNETGPEEMIGNSSDPILEVTNSGNGEGMNGKSYSSAGVLAYSFNDKGVNGESSVGFGVYGINSDMGNFAYLGNYDHGVYGKHYGGNYGYLGSENYGVYGDSYSGIGVYGHSNMGYGVEGRNGPVVGSLGGVNIGVRGECSGGSGVSGTSSSGNGVYGVTSSGYALRGESDGPGYAVYGRTTASGSNHAGCFLIDHASNSAKAVYGRTSGTGHAGYFNGDVHINGTLTKTFGTFKIDHPLDPENKYLYHSFVESPDMMNVYNGNVILDENGEAWVDLPERFEALNRDFRYQLTCIGGFARIYVAEEITDNRFKIGGGTPGMNVSWQVTGIRQDTYAKAHPMVVEQE